MGPVDHVLGMHKVLVPPPALQEREEKEVEGKREEGKEEGHLGYVDLAFGHSGLPGLFPTLICLQLTFLHSHLAGKLENMEHILFLLREGLW